MVETYETYVRATPGGDFNLVRVEAVDPDLLVRKAGRAVTNQRPLRVIASDFEETTPGSGVLRDWTTAHTGTASHTIAASTRTQGGNTLTLVDPDAAGLALVKSRPLPGPANVPQWYTTDEVVLTGSQQISFVIGSGVTLRAQILVVSTQVQINATDGLGVQVVGNVNSSTNFSSARAFRLGIWYDPRTGTARFYIFYDDGAGITRHAYMGQRVNSAGSWPITYVQINTSQSASGNASTARVEGYEVRGVLHGCSTDLPNNVYDTSPNRFPTQSRYYDSAAALALRLWGQREGIVNMAHGGWAYSTIYGGGLSAYGEDTATWANMVTALKPKFVVLGSGINSVQQVILGLSTMEAIRATAVLMIDAALAAGVGLVVVRNAAPVGGHVAYETSAKLDKVDEWNAWVNALPTLYPGRVAVSDVWSALVDPAVPRTLLPRYDIGDHLHFTVAGGEALADADAKAIIER